MRKSRPRASASRNCTRSREQAFDEEAEEDVEAEEEDVERGRCDSPTWDHGRGG